MAYRIMKNRINHSVTLHVTSSSANVVIVGNNSVSNIAAVYANGVSENVRGAAISQIWAGGDPTSVWTIKRGANTVWVTSPGSADTYTDFFGGRNPIDLDSAADISINLSGSTNSVCIIELKKLNPDTTY